MIRNTFIHTSAAGEATAQRRSHSVPKQVGSTKCQWEASCHSLGFMSEPLHHIEQHPPISPAVTASPAWTPRVHSSAVAKVSAWADVVDDTEEIKHISRLEFCVDEPLCLEDAHDSFGSMLPIMTPSPAWTPQWDSMPLIQLSRTVVRLSDFV